MTICHNSISPLNAAFSMANILFSIVQATFTYNGHLALYFMSFISAAVSAPSS